MFVSGLVSVFLFFHATGVEAFIVTTKNANVRAKENEGADLSCIPSADFGADARVEWKFRDMKGSTTYVIFDGKPTTLYEGRATKFDGVLRFSKVTRKDNGQYQCEVSNKQYVGDVKVNLTVLGNINTGGIVAGVIVALLALALLCFGLWYAHRKGYMPKKSESKPSVVYQPTSESGEDEDGEFRQKSSFVV
ncbi:junctional adhesion molecule A-like isoform X2 [Salvelinus alpinus]|uniref:junctional adhesion molecule A-like isoform X2 n=1 Tax=Salvelinus alpinus TaxID=8036 RepID=UPI0039FDABA9